MHFRSFEGKGKASHRQDNCVAPVSICLLTEEVFRKLESRISLQYNCRNLNLEITAKYDIDKEERMEIDEEPEVQPQHKFYLKMSGTGFNMESSFDYSEIKHYVTGIDSFLAKFVNSRVLVMKMIRCMSFYLRNRDSSVIHLVPGNEKLRIRKVDEHGRMSTFNYTSDPASDIMSRKEIDHINSFVGYHRTAPWLFSVLWLLSELAAKRFG